MVVLLEKRSLSEGATLNKIHLEVLICACLYLFSEHPTSQDSVRNTVSPHGADDPPGEKTRQEWILFH